jgi:hypothetical protein
VAAFLLWVRGTEANWAVRRFAARLRWSGPAALVAVASLVLALGAGGTILYNTNLLNIDRSPAAQRAGSARYERAFKHLERLDLPRLVAADVRADLEPERRAFGTSGTFTFVNKHSRPLDSLVVTIAHEELLVDTLAWDRPTRLLDRDPADLARIYQPRNRSHPATRSGYATGGAARGFGNDGLPPPSPPTHLLSPGLVSHLGYASALELTDDPVRRKLGLPPRVGRLRPT